MIHPDILKQIQQQRTQERLQEAAQARLIQASRALPRAPGSIHWHLWFWNLSPHLPWIEQRQPSGQILISGAEPCCLNL